VNGSEALELTNFLFPAFSSLLIIICIPSYRIDVIKSIQSPLLHQFDSSDVDTFDLQTLQLRFYKASI
jgi:hypothetical protein